MARNRHGFGWVFSRFRKNANTLLWINKKFKFLTKVLQSHTAADLSRHLRKTCQKQFNQKWTRKRHEIDTEVALSQKIVPM